MKAWMLLAAVVVCSAARGEPAKTPGDPVLDLPLEATTTNPDWRAKPSGEQVNAAFPKLAQFLKMSGRAQITCTAEPSGAVDECRIVQETPSGMGFGAAALSLAPYFQMRPATVDGRPVKGRIEVPIHFTMQATPRPAPLDAPPAVDAANLALAREILTLNNTSADLKRAWRSWLEATTTDAMQAGDARPSLEMLDALQASTDESTDAFLERSAHHLASRVPADQLRAIRDFLSSPAGHAMAAFNTGERGTENIDWQERVAWSARDRICAKIVCGDAPAK